MKLKTVREASEILGMSIHLIYYHIKRNNIKAVKVMGTLKIEESEIENLKKLMES